MSHTEYCHQRRTLGIQEKQNKTRTPQGCENNERQQQDGLWMIPLGWTGIGEMLAKKNILQDQRDSNAN